MDDTTILNEVHKGITMGMSSLEEIYNKTQDSKFKDELSYQFDNYQSTLDKVNGAFSKIGEIPDDNSINTKIMGWTGIQMNTLTDSSNSKLSEILIQGYDMGIIKGIRLLNQNPNASTDTKKIVSEFVLMQKNSIEKLEKYL